MFLRRWSVGWRKGGAFSRVRAFSEDEYQVCSGRSSSRKIKRSFVTGHDFSRADHEQKQGRALQAAEKLRKSGENSGRMTAGAKARPSFSVSCGTTKVVP